MIFKFLRIQELLNQPFKLWLSFPGLEAGPGNMSEKCENLKNGKIGDCAGILLYSQYSTLFIFKFTFISDYQNLIIIFNLLWFR